MSKNTDSAVEGNIPATQTGTEVNRPVKAETPPKMESLFVEPTTASAPRMPTPEELWVDPEKLAQGTAVRKVITVIPIRHPEAHEFFRTHPDPVWERQLVLIENKIEKRNAIYVAMPGLVSALVEMGIKYRMGTCFRPSRCNKRFS